MNRDYDRQRRKAYVPDLRRLGALGEANYRRLQKLFYLSSRGCTEDLRFFHLSRDDCYLGRMTIKPIEIHRYTDTLLLEQVHNLGKWLNNPRFTVRVYHDVRIAEVISCYRFHRIEPVNSYPNRYMHHVDEKEQINAFLAEWLGFCCRYGHEEYSFQL